MQRARAEAADWAWRNFQRPHTFIVQTFIAQTFIVDTKFGVDWAVREAQRAHGLFGATLDGA